MIQLLLEGILQFHYLDNVLKIVHAQLRDGSFVLSLFPKVKS